MLHIGGGPTIAELAGIETRANRLMNAGSYGLANYRRAQDSPFEVLDLMRRSIKTNHTHNYIGTVAGTLVVDENALNFDAQLTFFRQSDNRVLASLTVQTDNSQLSFSDSGGLQTARMNIFGWITTVANRRIGKFEDSVSATATAEELSSTRMKKSAYAAHSCSSPGLYKVDIIVRDVESGATGVRRVGFGAPSFPRIVCRLRHCSPPSSRKMESGAPVGQFVIGTTKVIPDLARVFRRGDPVGVYLQVYNAAIDQTTLRPAADAEYVLLKNGKELSKQLEDWRQINDSGQRLTLTRLIDSRSLAPGDYEIQVRIRDHVTGQTISPSATI